MNMLAFDLGASSGKTFLGKFNGELLDLIQVRRFDNNVVVVRNDYYWDVLRIYSELEEAIVEGLKISNQISSLGLDSFSNDFGLLDRNGHFINQVYSYRDNRTKRCEEKIYEIMPRERIHQLSGNQVALFPTLMQLAAMRLESQDHLLNGSSRLLFLPDLFIYFLTGEIASEYTISSVSQMLDFNTGDWNREIIKTFGLPLTLFPQIVLPGSKIGAIQPDRIVNGKKIDVVTVCEHDTASAFLAAPRGEESIIISSGTWSLIGIEVQHPIINEYTFKKNIANEGGYVGHHRILKNVMGLWLIQECCRAYNENGLDYSYAELMALAAKQESFKYLINPNDERFFFPGNMPQKIASYCIESGQGEPGTVGEIIRCVLESLALQYRIVIEELEAVSGFHYDRINIVGGGSNNHLLNQFVSDATGREVVAGPQEATAIGNLLMQLLAKGEIASIHEGRQIIAKSFPFNFYYPASQTVWNEIYCVYQLMIAEKMVGCE